jgi:organic hydroperoxide reductase OsmC/OhrA
VVAGEAPWQKNNMLWYLGLASSAKIVVHRYDDDPAGAGEVNTDKSGRPLGVTLRPSIAVADGTDLEQRRQSTTAFIATASLLDL